MLTRTFLFLSLIVFAACDKNAPKRNELFFCQVNGVAFRPGKSTKPIGGVGGDPLRTFLYPDKKEFAIFVDGSNQFVGLAITYKSESLQIGKYELSTKGNSNVGIYSFNTSIANSESIYSESGYFEITKINTRNISGTFAFKCTAKSGKIYSITKGCFNDVEYY